MQALLSVITGDPVTTGANPEEINLTFHSLRACFSDQAFKQVMETYKN